MRPDSFNTKNTKHVAKDTRDTKKKRSAPFAEYCFERNVEEIENQILEK
jgi:hypothetical protein